VNKNIQKAALFGILTLIVAALIALFIRKSSKNQRTN
jgi:hypothetical protein